MTRPAIPFTSLLLIWSLLTFGGVYPWAFWPIGVCAVTIFVLSWIAPRPEGAVIAGTLGPWLLLAFVPWLLQLIPLPTSLVEALSPASVFFLRNDTAFHAGGWARLSLAPRVTADGLVWVACLAMLFVGLIRTADARDFRLLAGTTTMLGCLVAAVGLGQMGDPLIYGVWLPLGVSEPFGPFVNRNHFAGWMVLALTLTAGLFARNLEVLRRDASGTWIGRMRTFSSREGCQVILLGGALLLMTTAIVASLSRSGLLATAVACMILLAFGVRRAGLRVASTVSAGLAIFAAIGMTVLAVGPAAIAARLESGHEAFASRWIVWQDAFGIVRGFPVLGAGFGTFGLVFPHFGANAPEGFAQAHNDYLQLGAEGGLIAALVSLLLVWRFVVEVFRRLQSESDAWFRVAALAGIAGIATQEAVEFSLRTPAVAVLFVVCCAAAVCPLVKQPCAR